MFGERLVNDDDLEERTVLLCDGPFDGARAVRPNARMRKTQHAQGYRLPDDQQPWQPGMPESEARVKFALYLWLPSDMKYCWVDYVEVRSERELMDALSVVADS